MKSALRTMSLTRVIPPGGVFRAGRWDFEIVMIKFPKEQNNGNIRSSSSELKVSIASFSSSFSPGAVLVTFSNSSFCIVARFKWSMILTSALKSAKTVRTTKWVWYLHETLANIPGR